MTTTERYREALAEIRMLAADMFGDRSKQIEAIANAALEGDQPVIDNRPELAPRQVEFLNFVEKYQASHGYSPTFREIGAGMGIKSTNGVLAHTRALQKKRYIRFDPCIARSIVLLEAS